MSTKSYPVVIVGAGPAGIAASLFLRAERIPHLLIEKDVFPRDKICGDAVSGKALEAIAKLFPEEVKAFGADRGKALLSYGIQFTAPNGKGVDIAFPPSKTELPVGFISTRMDFDSFFFSLLKDDKAET
nr:FAD-dependent monooxygenase [Bacteroidota bacterium]